MAKVKQPIDKLSPEELKNIIKPDELGPIREGVYTLEDYGNEVSQVIQDPKSPVSSEYGTYSVLLYITRQSPKVVGEIQAVWKKIVDEYEGVKEWNRVSLYDPIATDLEPLEIYDNIVGRPLREQEEYMRGLLPKIVEQRMYKGMLYESIENSILETHPDIKRLCEELVEARAKMGDPDPDVYSYEQMLTNLVMRNIDRDFDDPEASFDLTGLDAILTCYEWSKIATESLEALKELEQGPYKPLIEWIKGLAPEGETVLGYNVNLVKVKDILGRIIEEEGLTEDSPGDLKAIGRKWKKRVVKTFEEEPDEVMNGTAQEVGMITHPPAPGIRTLAGDKGNRVIPLIGRSEPTTLDYRGWDAEALINFASKGKPVSELKYHIITSQGEQQGITAIERAFLGYIGTLLRANTPPNMVQGRTYRQLNILENDLIKGFMGLVEGENIKTHQEPIARMIDSMKHSELYVEILSSNKQDDKFTQAIEEIWREMNPGAKLPKPGDDTVRLTIKNTMLSVMTTEISYKGAWVRQYTFDVMPFSEYIGIKFGQTIQVKDALYRTPILPPEDLTSNARDKAEELKLYSKDRKTKGNVLLLENNLENIGLKDWVATEIEIKCKKYGSPVILEYETLYKQIKGASYVLTDREKRTLRANLKKYLVYLMNNPESNVIDFKEMKASGSKKVVSIHVYLKEGKKPQ